MTTAGNALVVMTKVPEPGHSKTRLVPPLSYGEAAELARALLLDQLNNLTQFSGAQLHVAFAPAEAANAMRLLTPAGFTLFPQQGIGLGERMANAFAQLFARGFSRVVLIGGDLPALPLEIFDQAFAALQSDLPQVVLGPSADGGYHLAGMNRPLPEMFHGIAWSRPDVLQRTMERLTVLEISHKLLPSWYDIDTIDDLRHLAAEFVSLRQGIMKNTLTLLSQLWQRGVV